MKNIISLFFVLLISFAVSAQGYERFRPENTKKITTSASDFRLIDNALQELRKSQYSQAELYIDQACDINNLIKLHEKRYKIRFEYDDPISVAKKFYYASVVYGEIGIASSFKDSVWLKKVECCLDMFNSVYWEIKEVPLELKNALYSISFVRNFIHEAYFAEGMRLYNEKKYELAQKKFGDASGPNRRLSAATYLMKAKCYAHLIELNEAKKYPGNGRNITMYLTERCKELDDEGIHNTDYIYEVVGNSLYRKGKNFLDKGFYKSAEKYADSAAFVYGKTGRNDLVKKAKALSTKSKQNNTNKIPEDPFSVGWNSLCGTGIDVITNTSQTNNNTHVFILFNSGSYTDKNGSMFACNSEPIKLFGEYCNKTLGIPNNNIHNYRLENPDSLSVCLNLMKTIASSKGRDLNIIVLYTGPTYHDAKSNEDFMLLWYGDDKTAISLNRFYSQLGTIPTLHTICFIDAHRTLVSTGMGLQSARIKSDEEEETGSDKKGGTIKIKNPDFQEVVYNNKLPDNMMVFTSSAITWTDVPLGRVESVSYFLYYLLRYAQRSNGEISLGKLYDYLNYNVRRISYEKNDEFQIPTISTNPNIGVSWRNIKL